MVKGPSCPNAALGAMGGCRGWVEDRVLLMPPVADRAAFMWNKKAGLARIQGLDPALGCQPTIIWMAYSHAKYEAESEDRISACASDTVGSTWSLSTVLKMFFSQHPPTTAVSQVQNPNAQKAVHCWGVLVCAPVLEAAQAIDSTDFEVVFTISGRLPRGTDQDVPSG